MPDAMATIEALEPVAWLLALGVAIGLLGWLVLEVRGLRRAHRESAASWARIARVQEAEPASGPGLSDDRVALKAAAAVLLALKRQHGTEPISDHVDLDSLRSELADLLADWEELDTQLERIVAAVEQDRKDPPGS